MAKNRYRSVKRPESPETDNHKYSQRIFDKRAKVIQWKKDSFFFFFSMNGARIIEHSYAHFMH